MLSSFALQIAQKRFFMENEDWERCVHRVSHSVANAEVSDESRWAEEFGRIIFNRDFIPAGRILRNAGRPRGSMFNCYVLPFGDSREEIGQFFKDSLILWGEGGGVGVNCGTLRPQGSPIKGVGGFASGPVSFLHAADAIAQTVESGGQRRAAALALLDVSHPDILRFIDAKMTHGELSHFNISVAVTDEFLDAVETDGEWGLVFRNKVYETVPARRIWDRIVENMALHAEPGLLNWDNLAKNNSYYFDPISCVNPCGEAVLPPYGVCDLGSLVLPNFITGKVNLNRQKLEATIKLAVRFLDDVIDVNSYVLKEIQLKAQSSRRIGLGIMGLAEYLFIRGLRYGSPEALVEVDRLMRFIKECVYASLVELATEKGAFPAYERTAYSKASFIRKLPAALRTDIKRHGCRCVTGMAIAPTGTISLLADVSSSIEPLFSKAYIRKDRVSERVYIHPRYKEILATGEPIPEYFVDTFDLKPEDHLETQAAVQRHVDGAVSKTINLPRGTKPVELSDLLLEYIHDVKGVTVYVDGSREGQVLEPLSEKATRDYLATATEEREEQECATGMCEV